MKKKHAEVTEDFTLRVNSKQLYKVKANEPILFSIF